jgi:ectoine hydroxylase-related dioxygenase (phytanoyl-CoA dioxygenase family)
VLGFSQSITDYGPADQAREVEIHLEPGDAVAHHCEMIHRADANLSPTRNRRAVALVFNGASARRDEEAFQSYREAAREQHLAKGLKV